MVAFGAFFLGSLKDRTKIIGLNVVGVLFVLYTVIGNTTRHILGTGGFTNMEERVQAMGHWREVFDVGPVLAQVFGRLFPTAGHTIITKMPDQYAYMDFSPGTFVQELVTRVFVPGAIYYQPTYGHTGILIPYGFTITESTSVEVSTIGSFWMLGGWLPLMVGALGIGLLHGLFSRWLDRAADASPTRALFYLGMLAWTILWAENLTHVEHTRSLIIHAVAGVLLYWAVVRPIAPDRTAGDFSPPDEAMPDRQDAYAAEAQWS
jgi:hypothetical protein